MPGLSAQGNGSGLVDAAGRPLVSVERIGGVAPQMDDTDKLAVSLHARGTVDGDTPVAVQSTVSRNLRVTLYSGGSIIGATATGNDGSGNNLSGLDVFPRNFLSNETTWDRQRNNVEATLLASAARTATTASADQTNYNARGVIVTIDVTAISASPSITMDIEFRENIAGRYESFLLTSAAITTTGVHSYIVYPGVGAASGDVVQVAGFPLGRTWRVNVTHADADSITYSVAASYIL